MNALPSYMKGDLARFDFRVPDGLGNFTYPDWDDPDLKVEFYDSDSVLQFTATTSSSPALVQYDDYDQGQNPDGGPFVSVDGIDLGCFSLGIAEAKVYAKVGGMEVFPYPSIISAFEVIAQFAQGPLYTSASRVREQIPGEWPQEVTDEMVTQAIADAGRKMDAFLQSCYDTPFPDVNDDPPTPAVLETICRKLAAHQCLQWMGRVNAASEENLKQRALAELMRLAPAEGKAPVVRLTGYKGPVASYQGELKRSDLEHKEDVLA